MDYPTTLVSYPKGFLRVDEEMWDSLELQWVVHLWTVGRSIPWNEVQEKMDAFECKYGSLDLR